jgi:Domain of unknown function (DUF6930)/SEC-C motif
VKTGRNAPCPCGSGKKYKACCLRLESANRGLRIEEPVRQAAARAGTWQADLLPVSARFEDDPGARPGVAMVTAAGFVLFTEMLARPSPEVDAIAATLATAIAGAVETIGSAPEKIAVREPEVAAALAPRLRAVGLEVAVHAAPLAELEEAMAALNQSMGGHPRAIVGTRPATWRGWGHPDEWIAELFRRCAVYYRAAPWERFDDLPPILAETPTGQSWVLSVLGSAKVEYGLGFYSSPADYKAVLDGVFSIPGGRVLGLTFDRARDLEPAMRKEVAAAEWEVASADAYPTLLTIGCPAGGLRAADAADLLAIVGAVAAWTAAIDGDEEILCQGPWTDPETGVALEWAGTEIERLRNEVVRLEPGDAQGPGAAPLSRVDETAPDRREPAPRDEVWLRKLAAHLKSRGLSDATVRLHAENADLFLDYLANWAGVPIAAVHEFDLRSFLFDWYPRKVDASRSRA